MTFIPPNTQGALTDVQKEDQRQVLARFLSGYGLTGLDAFINNAVVNSWSPERVELELRDTETFKQAFPEIEERKKRGLPAVSPSSVLEYRQEVKRTMFNAGLPSGFYDEPSDFVDLMAVKDLSPAEIKARVEEGFARVASAPPAVRATFAQFFGQEGDGALAAFFLDPQRAAADLQKKVQTAEVGGYGKQFGFNVDLTRAEQLAAQGKNASQVFETANAMRGLADETFTEEEDLTEDELISGAFGESGAQQDLMKRRGQERQAAFGGGGGAASTQKGFGIGAAE